MTDEGGKSTNRGMVPARLRHVLLALLIAVFGAVLEVIASHANAPPYVLVLILMWDIPLILYAADLIPVGFLASLVRRERPTLRAVRVFLVWLLLVIGIAFVVNWAISLPEPSSIIKAREPVRTIELALERGELCSVDTQSRDPEIANVRLWFRYDSMMIEPLAQELTTTPGVAPNVSTVFFKKNHVIAVRSPASGGRGFHQTYYDGDCVVGIDHLDNNLAIQALDYLACQEKNIHMDSNDLFWRKNKPPFKQPFAARPCMLGSMGGTPTKGNVSVLPVPGVGLPYR